MARPPTFPQHSTAEKNYRISARADDRAIAGLSMGGNQTLEVGLTHLDTFHYIGAFSPVVFNQAAESTVVRIMDALLGLPCPHQLCGPRLIGQAARQRRTDIDELSTDRHTTEAGRSRSVRAAPQAAIALNTRPDDSGAAAAR
jgi:S-formylglutathione hydrolase FrmB